MLKSDLIAVLVTKRGVTQAQAESTVETIFGRMKDALCKGENIEIRGQGAIHVKHYDGYQGRNPNTRQVIEVKPKRGILWRTGKELRERMNRLVPATAERATGVPFMEVKAELGSELGQASDPLIPTAQTQSRRTP
jgi:integration host factor subunit beta